MHMKHKKGIAILLTLAMLFSILPAGAVWATETTDSTAAQSDIVLMNVESDSTTAASITTSGGVMYYTDFTTAVENWTDNTTLTLLADVTNLSEQIELSGNGLVLDLNGKKLEATVDDAIKITAGELTIRDSARTGSFTTTQYGVLWLHGGNVNFESGTLESVTISKGTFNMTGGTVQAEAYTGIDVAGDEGTANISGGEIKVTDNNRTGIYNGFGTLNLSGNVVITSTYGYAFQNSSASVLTTISGDVALNGSTGELYLGKAIVLNTQPNGDTKWDANINTSEYTGIKYGVFAIPGEGVTLDPAKFTSLMDGYEVKLNKKNELVLCNHSSATTAVSNGNGTHNTTCDCNGNIFESNIACSGGVATANHLAVCAYCGGTYGELDADVNYDIIATAMTAAELKDAMAAWLADGNTDMSILLAAYADEEMFTAVKTALAESSVADGSVNLTLAGVKTIPDEALSDYPISIGGNKLKTLTLTDAETTGENEPFARCTYLESVSLPNAITIGAWAFNECSNLTSVYCPKVTTIGRYAFRKCEKLTTFDFTNITTIGDGAFRGCGFNTIVIPEATSIGGSAFVDNPNLISFSAPKATSFGWYPWGAETIETSKLESLELTAAGEFTIENNFSAYTPFEQINLVLNIDKTDQVIQKDDGTATWTYPYTNSSTGTETKTFKSITLTCVDGTTNHTYQYTDMSNGTHKAECTVEGCGFYKYEAHTPDADGYTDNANGTTHKAKCVCGAVYDENHTLTYSASGNVIINGCSKCAYEIGTAAITAENATYDGTEQKTATVAYSDGWSDNKDLIPTYENNINAGTATASITMGEGDTAATARVNFAISPAELSVSDATVADKLYDGTTSAMVSEIAFSGFKGSDTLVAGTDYTVTAAFTDASAGDNKSVTVTVTLLDTTAAKNYTLTNNTYIATANITKADSVVTPSVESANITATYGDTITITATVGPKEVATFANTVNDVAENSVAFYYGDTLLGTVDNVPVTGGEVTFIYDTKENKVPTGTHTITAQYGGSVKLNGSNSDAINVTLYKAVPAYIVPTGLTATYGQTLATVALPDGFTWQDATQAVNAAGTFKAVFTPADTDNYQTVTDIDIIVTHAHTHAAEWSNDDTNHWHACPCGDKADIAGHIYDNDTDTTCICGYTRTITPSHTHILGTKYSTTEHWQECTAEGCPDLEGSKANLAAHSFDDDMDADCNDGCGYTRTVDSDGSEGSGSISSGYSGGYIPSTPSVSDKVEITVPDAVDDAMNVEAETITTSTLNDVKDVAADDETLSVIGGKGSAVQIVAKENGKAVERFTQPVSVTVPVSKADIKNVTDTGKLTLAMVTTDENGDTQLTYVGGKYDADKGTFSAYTDKPGNYVLVEKDDLTKIELTIDHPVADVNGRPVVKDVQSRIVDERTLVPARFILQHMGCGIDWNGDTRTVIVTLPDGRVLTMPVDEPIPGFGAAPMIEDGRTLVPVAYIAYAMEAQVLWVEDERKVVIVK